MRSSRLVLACFFAFAPFTYAAEHPIESELRRTFPSVFLESRATFARDHVMAGSVAAAGLRTGWTPTDAPLRVLYPDSFDAPMVIETSTQRVVLRAKGARSSVATPSNGKLVYAGAYDSIDVVAMPYHGRSEQLFVVRDRNAPAAIEYEIVETEGVLAITIDDGSIRFVPMPGERKPSSELAPPGLRIIEHALRLQAPIVVDSDDVRHKGKACWSAGSERPIPQTLTLTIDEPAGDVSILVISPISIDGMLGSPRRQHTATLLLDGRVLCAGGYGMLGEGLASTEVYDPRNGVSTPAASLHFGRYSHSATLLPDGGVLFVGGLRSAGQHVAALECFEPSQGNLTIVGDLLHPRARHAATLLRDGRVLITGGLQEGSVALRSAEIFDPVTRTVVAVDALRDRAFHTATLLRDGRVLVAGGGNADILQPSAEIFDPVAGAFVLGHDLNDSRTQHSATLLPDGRVLVAGGYAYTYGSALVSMNGVVTSGELFLPETGDFVRTSSGLSAPRENPSATLLPGGAVFIASAYSSEFYRPATDEFVAGPVLSYGRYGHTATILPSGTVLIAGGGVLEVEEYGPATPSIAAAGTMALARTLFTATPLANGKVLIAGGLAGESGPALNSAVLFDPQLSTFTATGNLTAPRFNHTATLLTSGKVLIVGGGHVEDPGAMASAELYDPSTGQFTATDSLESARQRHTATLLMDGRVLVAGGWNPNVIAALELFDPDAGMFTTTGAVTDPPMSHHTATLLADGTVLFCGGRDNGGVAITSTSIYRPATGAIHPGPSMLSARFNHTATTLPDGRVLIAGGESAYGTFVQAAEWFDPSIKEFIPAGTILGPRSAHTATLLPDGRVFIAGGNSSLSWMPLASTELFDMRYVAADRFRPGPSLATARGEHAAALLHDGRVMVAGGRDLNPLASAEIFDPGLGFDASRRPVLTSVPSTLALPARLTIVGSGFRGDSEGSSSATNSSPANYPIVHLQRLDQDAMQFLEPTSPFTDTTWSTLIPALRPGFYRLTMFVNGIPSTPSKIVRMTLATPTITGITPTSGSVHGGQQATITGTNLVQARVAIGGALATVLDTTATTVTLLTPPHASAVVDVTVSTPAGVSATAVGAYTYIPDPPTNVIATATSATSVSVTWTRAEGATHHQVLRKAAGGSFVALATVAGTSYTDATATANKAYLYAVRATAPIASGQSASDLATTVVWTDPSLVAGITPARAVHLTQLRTAVNAVRTLAALPAAVLTDPVITPGVTPIKAVHITQLRTALNQARSTLLLAPWTYTGTITPLVSSVRACDVTDLRNGVR